MPGFSEGSLISVGLLFLAAGVMLWRVSRQRQRLQQQDPLRELEREIRLREQSPETLIHEMEVRLFDYGREVEGRVETTLHVLDRLILDAELEIQRLETLLQTSSVPSRDLAGMPASAAESILTTEQQLRLPALRAAGLTDEEIARCLGCEIQLIHSWRGPNRDAA